MPNQAQFPGFMPLQFAQGPDMSKALAGLGNAAGAAGKAAMAPGAPVAQDPGSTIPGAAGPTAVGGQAGPMPLQPPTLMDALKNMSPSQVMAALQRTSQPPPMPGPQPGMQQPGMQPGSALFQQAGQTGMMPGPMPSTYGG
jgi:hypothetical protein